jgi:hypothetical protein
MDQKGAIVQRFGETTQTSNAWNFEQDCRTP